MFFCRLRILYSTQTTTPVFIPTAAKLKTERNNLLRHFLQCFQGDYEFKGSGSHKMERHHATLPELT